MLLLGSSADHSQLEGAPYSPPAYFDDDALSDAKRPAHKASASSEAPTEHQPLARTDDPPSYDAVQGPSHLEEALKQAAPADICAVQGHDPQVNIPLLVLLVAVFPAGLPFLLMKKKQECRRCGEWVDKKPGSCCMSRSSKEVIKRKPSCPTKRFCRR